LVKRSAAAPRRRDHVDNRPPALFQRPPCGRLRALRQLHLIVHHRLDIHGLELGRVVAAEGQRLFDTSDPVSAAVK